MALSLVASYDIVHTKAGLDALTTSSVVALDGDLIEIYVGYGILATIETVVWGSLGIGSGIQQATLSQDALSSLDGYVAQNVAAGTHDVVVSFDILATAAVHVRVWRGLDDVPLDEAVIDSVGSGTTPSAGPSGTLAQANELQSAAVLTRGPVADDAGTWGNSLTADKRDGTTGGVASTNLTLSTAYREVSATDAVTASKSGITSRAWAAVEATFTITPAASVAVPASRTSVSVGVGL